MKVIDSFNGVYSWLSNFYMQDVWYDGELYQSAEHAYQSSKAISDGDRVYVKSATTPGLAKARGRQVKCRSDWELIKLEVMAEIIDNKFKNKKLAELLLETGEAQLFEGNSWSDTFWGVTGPRIDRRGENWLGRILMSQRVKLRKK